MTEMKSPSCRAVLAAGGAAAGLTGLGMAAWGQNMPEADPAGATNTDFATDVLALGSGMAGLFAAVKAHDARARTMIVAKGQLGASGLTPFAKGFFAYDAATEALSDDAIAAAVTCSAPGTPNPVFTQQLAVHSADRAAALRDWGVFDQTLACSAVQGAGTAATRRQGDPRPVPKVRGGSKTRRLTARMAQHPRPWRIPSGCRVTPRLFSRMLWARDRWDEIVG